MLPTDLNFFAPNYCSDPFFSRANFLMNEETEEFIDKPLESKSSENIEIVNDQEMTLDQKHTHLCELILNKKFEEAIVFYKENLASSLSQKLFKEKLSHTFSESGLTYENLKETLNEFHQVLSEKTGLNITYGENSFSCHHFSKPDIDKQLKTFQWQLAEIVNFSLTNKSKEPKSTAFKVALSSLGIIIAVSRGDVYSGSTFLLMPLLPIFKASKHLLGATTSVIAYAAGADATTAYALGISASVLAHNVPNIASLFQRIVVKTNPIVKTGLNGIVAVGDGLAKGMDFIIQKVDGGIMWLDRRGAFDNRATRFTLNIINTAPQTVKSKINSWLFA